MKGKRISISSDSVYIRSWQYKNGDMVHSSDIGSVEMVSPYVVKISVSVLIIMGILLVVQIVGSLPMFFRDHGFCQMEVEYNIGIFCLRNDGIKRTLPRG